MEKINRKGFDLCAESMSKITDIAGIRVICNYIDDIYKIAELLLKQSDIELVREKDYIEDPKKNGYRSLHLVVLVPVFLSDKVEKVPVELQIRTVVMDAWASLEHELKYKREEPISKTAVKSLKQCAEEMAAVDARMQKIHREL
jgi:putative GTP pyrophosphokinase